MTSGCAEADHAGARPFLHRCAGTRSRDDTHVQRRGRERIECLGDASLRIRRDFCGLEPN
jgi:hypothetical protein